MPLGLPLADMGTPLMIGGALHLLFGNFIIGVGEGLLIAWLFKVRPMRAVLWMIPANYFSMIFGEVLLNSSLAVRFSDWFLGEAPLYNIGKLLVIAAVFSYLITIFLEWPFVAAAMWKTRHGIGRTLLASFAAQTASYLVLILFYSRITHISLITEPTMATVRDLIKTSSASVYYIDSEDQQIYQLPLDGSPRRRVGTVLDGNRQQLELIPPTDGAALDLCVTTPDNSTVVVMPAVAPSGHGSTLIDARSFMGGPAVDLRSPGVHVWHAWEVRTGFWPTQGLSAINTATNQQIHLALETPFMSWWSRCATVLPGDQVIYEVGEQVVLLDLATKRIALLAQGYSPVVIIAEPATAPISTQPQR